MDLLRQTYPLPARCSVNTVTIRETNGIDEKNAAIAADAKDGNVIEELIRIAIVEVDGEKVNPPASVQFEAWTTRTRKAVIMFFNRLNDASDEEMAPLFVMAEKAAASLTAIHDDEEDDQQDRSASTGG